MLQLESEQVRIVDSSNERDRYSWSSQRLFPVSLISMKLWQVCGLLLAWLTLAESYSKYGRTCKDIGCLSNEVCVMETDPCSYYQRQNECGSYPTCKKVDNGPPSCKNYVCPPTKVCRMDGNTPKCVDDHSKVGRVGYDTSELKNPNDQPSSGGNLYPNLPRGETTPRPNVPYQAPGGPGYQGGQIGSGYPGQPRPNYPQQGYPQQPYPGYNGYNNGYNPQGGYRGYPQQNSGYPNYNYNNQRYPNNYQGGNYNPYGQQNRYGNSGSGGLVDSLGNALKQYGLFYMIVAYFYQRIWDF